MKERWCVVFSISFLRDVSLFGNMNMRMRQSKRIKKKENKATQSISYMLLSTMTSGYEKINVKKLTAASGPLHYLQKYEKKKKWVRR